MLLIFLLPFSRQANILNKNYAKHQKRMSTSRGLNMHVPRQGVTRQGSGRQGVFDT